MQRVGARPTTPYRLAAVLRLRSQNASYLRCQPAGRTPVALHGHPATAANWLKVNGVTQQSANLKQLRTRLFVMGRIGETQPAMSITILFAALGLLACVLIAVHMVLRPNQQRWLNARLRRLAWRLRDAWQHLRTWRQRRQLQKNAVAEAAAAIERARAKADGTWDGNVYRPKQFEKKRRDDKRNLH